MLINIISIIGFIASLITIYNFILSEIKTLSNKESISFKWIKNIFARLILKILFLSLPFLLTIGLILYDIYYFPLLFDKFTIVRLSLNYSIFVCYFLFLIVYRLLNKIRKELDIHSGRIKMNLSLAMRHR